MSYILGFWFADGSVERSVSIRGHYIRVGSTEYDVVAYIKEQLSAQHNIHKAIRTPRKTYHLLRIGDQQLYNDLTRLGVIERKSCIVTFPKVPKKYLPFFVRGYFDGDGCVYLEKSENNSTKRLTTIFTSGSLVFLDQLRSILADEIGTPEKKKISITKGSAGTVAYQLRFSSRDSLKLYYFMYKSSIYTFSIKRKEKQFEAYLLEKGLEMAAYDLKL